MFGRAIEADPNFAAAHAAALIPYIVRSAYGWISGAHEFAEAAQRARKAVELDQEDPSVLAPAGYILAAFGGEYEKGRGLLEKALRLNPNLAWAQGWCGLCRTWNGEYREAIESFETLMRLDPLNPYAFIGPCGLAQDYFFLNEPAKCGQYAELAIRTAPDAAVVQQVEILTR